jgi:hypothetical protein
MRKISAGNISGAFYKDLGSVKNRQKKARLTHVVLGLKKNGEPYSLKTAWDLNFCRSKADAEKRQAYLESANPGSHFTVVEL